MPNLNLRNITNSFRDMTLNSLASYSKAGEIIPRDRGGPYVITQQGYDPEDPKVIPDEFVLGRSGKWLPLGLFFKLPDSEQRAEYVFGTAAEAMETIGQLPSKVQIARFGSASESALARAERSSELNDSGNE